MLRRHATAQKEDRLPAGSEWVDSGLVFTNEFGGPVEPRNLLRVIEVAAKAAGVEGIGVHTLRHSAAVAWLEAGVHIKAVIAICSGTRRSRSRATCTGTPPRTRPGPRSTGWRDGWDSRSLLN
jgi:integrase